MVDGRSAPLLSLIGGSAAPVRAPRLRRALGDGTVALTIGAALLTGFGVEAIKSFVTGDAHGLTWLVFALAGGAAVAFGWWQRVHGDRPPHIGLVVAARDARRDLARADQLNDAARRYVTRDGMHAWCVVTDLAGDDSDATTVDLLCGQVHAGAVACRTLAGPRTRIDLVPIMPLHAAFRLGAQLGHTHPNPITLHALRPDGEPPFFPAIRLEVSRSTSSPLVVEPMETIPGGDPAHVALAVNLQGLPQFLANVRASCRAAGVGRLCYLHTTGGHLDVDARTYSATVDQICRAWDDATLSDEARNGPHSVYLSGPVVISLALGARLATANSSGWTAHTWNDPAGSYEPMPAGPNITAQTGTA